MNQAGPDKIDMHDRALHVAWWTLLALGLGAVVVARIHLLRVPLERDEGEYAYAGQLILQGIPPYKLAYNMKFPGVYAAYAAIMWLFGQTISGIHIGLFVVNFATVLFVFLIGRRLLGMICGAAAAIAYGVLSVSPSVLGFAGHATHFVVLPALAGAYLLLARLDRRPMVIVFGSGILFGIALVMKQPALFFVLFGASYLVIRAWRDGLAWQRIILRTVAFGLGVILPFAVTCFFLWKAGVFGMFWFWTINYAREYGSLAPISMGVKFFGQSASRVIGWSWGLWLLALIGLALSVWDKKARTNALVFLLPLLLFSALALSAGLYFRQHYFIQVLPVASLLAGAAVALGPFAATRRPARWAGFIVFVAALTIPVFHQWQFLFRFLPSVASRAVYGPNPFPEAVRIAEFLQQRTSAEDTIAVIGSEPEIYFYANRHSATGYIYTYSLMEPQRYAAEMQRQMIQEIETARPKYVIFIAISYSWIRQPASNSLIFDWFDRYSVSNLTCAGVVNIISPERTDYYLPYMSEPVQLSPNHILIYERRL